MRSVRLRRGVAIFTFVVFCALLVTNLYAPDAGTDASRFDATHENHENAIPLPAAVQENTIQPPERNRQGGKNRSSDRNWQWDQSWQRGENWENYNSVQDSDSRHKRTDLKIVSRYRSVTPGHHLGYKNGIAVEGLPNHLLDYHSNATLNLPKPRPYKQPGHRKDEGSANFLTSGPTYRPDNRDVSASKSVAVIRDYGSAFGAKGSQRNLARDHRKDDRNQGAVDSQNLGQGHHPSDRSLGGNSADYRYVATSRGHPALWPEDSNSTDDRILAQLNYIPRTYSLDSNRHRRTRTKKIYAPGGLGDVPSGRRKFLEDGCSVSACTLTTEGRFRSSADLVLLQLDAFFEVPPSKPRNQVWVMWLLESPINTALFRNLENVINWTATYRSDSTIVTPYEKFVINPAVRQVTVPKNHAAGKSRLVAWFVSNCLADNRRWEYMLELRRYVPIDVFGACGELECQRDREGQCNEMLRTDYKFYLSFENSNCEYYITEKFFQRALWNDVVPIAMGARRADYATVAPPHSYIHVEDFASPRHLADYLLKLNASDELYNEYFAWKSQGKFANTKFWCRLCALLHDDTGHASWYPDVEKWWRANATCTRSRWDEPTSLITDWAAYHKSRARGR